MESCIHKTSEIEAGSSIVKWAGIYSGIIINC